MTRLSTLTTPTTLGMTRESSNLAPEGKAEDIPRLSHENKKMSGLALNIQRIQHFTAVTQQVDEAMKHPLMTNLQQKIRDAPKGVTVVPNEEEDKQLRVFYSVRCRRTVAFQQALHACRCCKSV